jgi:hypothetical protein
LVQHLVSGAKPTPGTPLLLLVARFLPPGSRPLVNCKTNCTCFVYGSGVSSCVRASVINLQLELQIIGRYSQWGDTDVSLQRRDRIISHMERTACFNGSVNPIALISMNVLCNVQIVGPSEEKLHYFPTMPSHHLCTCTKRALVGLNMGIKQEVHRRQICLIHGVSSARPRSSTASRIVQPHYAALGPLVETASFLTFKCTCRTMNAYPSQLR